MLHVQPSWFWSCSSHKEISFVLPTPCRQAGRPHLLKLSPKTVLNGILAISTGTRCSTSISVLKLVLILILVDSRCLFEDYRAQFQFLAQ